MLCLVKMRSPLATIHQSDHWVVVWWNFGLDHQPELQQADVIRCHPRTRVQGKHFFADSRFRCWCFCLSRKKWEMRNGPFPTTLCPGKMTESMGDSMPAIESSRLSGEFPPSLLGHFLLSTWFLFLNCRDSTMPSSTSGMLCRTISLV